MPTSTKLRSLAEGAAPPIAVNLCISSDAIMALCDQPKTVTAFPVVASSTMIASCKMVKPSSTDVLRTKLLTPVSGYNSSGVKTACSARRTDLQRIGGVNIDGGGSGIPVGPKNKVVKFAGNGGIIAAAAGVGAAAGTAS